MATATERFVNGVANGCTCGKALGKLKKVKLNSEA